MPQKQLFQPKNVIYNNKTKETMQILLEHLKIPLHVEEVNSDFWDYKKVKNKSYRIHYCKQNNVITVYGKKNKIVGKQDISFLDNIKP